MQLRPSPYRVVLIPAVLAGLQCVAQLNVSTAYTPLELVENVLLGQGVSVSNISYNGVPSPPTAQDGSGSFVTVNSNLGLTAGIILATGTASGVAQAESAFMSDQTGTGPDPDLELISGGTINDRSVLEFDFVPTGDSLKFRYVFGSEEYPEWVCSFNDVFGFFLSGPGISGGMGYVNDAVNIALVPNSTLQVGVNSINNGDNDNPNDPTCPAVNPQYYVHNNGGTTVVFDAFTTVLEARALVQCGLTYHIKLAIGDALDQSYDSGVFLEAGSFTSTGQVVPTLVTGNVSANDSTLFEGCGIIPLEFHRLGDTSNVDTIDLVVSGSATPGVDYFPAFPTQLIYQPGDTIIPWPITVPLDADGLETVVITIAQNIVCSGTQVVNDYTFYIDQFAPLNVVTNDVNGDCGGQYALAPVVTGGTGLYQYAWSTGDTTPSITVSPGVTTVYQFTVSDTCGVLPVTNDIVVTMPVYPPLQIQVSPTTLIDCLGNGDIGVLDVSGGNGTYTYEWSLSGSNAGTTATINVPAANPPVQYVAVVTDGCGTEVSDSVEVGTVPLDPIVITAPDRTVICQGDTITLNVVNVTGGNGVYTYQWTNPQMQVLSTADTLQVVVPADNTYMITVADQCGYSGDTLVRSLIPHPEPFVLEFNPDTVLCLGESLRLQAVVSGGSGYYLIDWPGYDLHDPIMEVSPTENAVYSVMIHDQCGEIISDVVNVGVEGPVAQIIATNMGVDDWHFNAATLPTFCRSYRWDLGDSTTSRAMDLLHSYLDMEEHWVHLSVVTYNGCVAEDSVLIRPPGGIFFPNAFTPDGDGINDSFGPQGSYIEAFEMTVYDRWGELIYTTTSMGLPWDGKVNGVDASTGVYVYKFKATGHLFPAKEAFGHVTLLRGANSE